jgi:hypothetical protein
MKKLLPNITKAYDFTLIRYRKSSQDIGSDTSPVNFYTQHGTDHADQVKMVTYQWRQATVSPYSPGTSSPYLKLPTAIGEPVQGAGPLQTDRELLLY